MKRKVKFYADTIHEKNKLFHFYVNDEKDALKCLKRFHNKNFKIRAAWYSESDEKGHYLEKKIFSSKSE